MRRLQTFLESSELTRRPAGVDMSRHPGHPRAHQIDQSREARLRCCTVLRFHKGEAISLRNMAVGMSANPDERVGFPANQAQALVLWPLIACTDGLTMCSEVDPR